MDKRRTQLCCTFSTEDQYENDIRKIFSYGIVVDEKIYVLENREKPNEIFLTYNVAKETRPQHVIQNTITVHRNRDFNVLYSINALNLIILDKLDRVDWSKFGGSLVTGNNGILSVIPTYLREIKINNLNE